MVQPQSMQGNEKKTKDPAASIVDGGRLADRAIDPAAPSMYVCMILPNDTHIHTYSQTYTICTYHTYVYAVYHTIHMYA